MQALAKAYSELRSVQLEADRLRAQIKGRDGHINELKGMLEKRVTEFDRMREDLKAAERQLKAQEDSLKAQADSLKAKDAQLANLEAEVAALRERLASGGPATLGDDLKRVRGIGVGFERILKDNGVTTYAQLAAWTGDDILRFATLLKTQPGRIARGAWIEQAAALVAGVSET
jgi:predicted flap endonuclease-1-like 5' DNA nuclease